MAAGAYDLALENGADFSVTFTYLASDGVTPINLTNYTAKSEIRPSLDWPDPALITLTNGNGITLGGAAGTIILALTYTQVALLMAQLPSGQGVWDLFIYSPATPSVHSRVVAGAVKVQQVATR